MRHVAAAAAAGLTNQTYKSTRSLNGAIQAVPRPTSYPGSVDLSRYCNTDQARDVFPI